MGRRVIGADPFSSIFGLVSPGGGEDQLPRIAKAAVKAGFAIVVCKPGTKIPMCTLTSRQVATEDRKAREAAAGAGHPRAGRVRHACGIAHAITDPDVVARVVSRMVKTHGPVNLGVELGRSRVLVVDVDTDTETEAFLRDWSAATGRDETGRTPTVRSPGVVGVDGGWKHKNGGHWWFMLPAGVELPTGVGVMKAPGGWCAMWADRQVLIPPSVRSEGAYELIGRAEEAPRWVVERITREAGARAKRIAEQRDKIRDVDDPIERWSAGVTWAELLEQDEWVSTGLADGCGCPIWTAPGVHASPKSATAHEPGCTRYDTDTGWGPLHIWTDNAPEWLAGRKTVSKLSYLSLRDHQGNDRATLQELGIVAPDKEFPGYDVNEVLGGDEALAGGDTDPFVSAGGPHETGSDQESLTESHQSQSQPLDPVQSLLSRMLTSAELDELVEPEPLIHGLLDRDTLARMVGKSGHGKSFTALDMAACVATGQPWHGRKVEQGLVVYMVAEGSRGWKKRLRAWESKWHGGTPIPGSQLLVIPFPVQTAIVEQWRAMRLAMQHLRPALIVLDTQARITVGVNENDATDMGVFVERLEQLRRETGACVMPVHHLGHNGDQGRGSSAVIGAMNTEIRVVKTAPGQVEVHTDKQKDEAEGEPLAFTLVAEGDSVVLDGDASIGDPFESVKPTNEEVMDTKAEDLLGVLRVAAPEHGLTKAELKGLCVATREAPDRPMSKATFYRSWDRMVTAGRLLQVMNSEGKLTQRWVAKTG